MNEREKRYERARFGRKLKGLKGKTYREERLEILAQVQQHVGIAPQRDHTTVALAEAKDEFVRSMTIAP